MAVPDGYGGCCGCGQLVGCQCGGLACSISCRAKAGTATLCGFEELVDPSTPPKKYRRRTIAGTMSISKYLDDECGGLVTVAAGLYCRSKTGTASLCGYGEYSSVSTPPRLYRRAELAGSVTGRFQMGVGCAGAPGYTLTWSYSGAYTFSATTCATTNGQLATRSDGPVVTPAQRFGPQYWNLLQAHCVVSSTSTVKTWYYPGTCDVIDFYTDMNGTVTETLSDEDTEADALARALASIGSWVTAGACSSHTSYRVQRTTGTSFGFRQGQIAVNIASGLVIGASYEARIAIERRAWGSSGAWSAHSEHVHTFSAAAAGYTSDWIDLPNEAGWEYRANSVEVYGHITQLIQDTWDLVQQYSEAACALTETDNSTRQIDGGAPEPIPADNPVDAYLPPHVAVDAQSDQRTITGADTCQPAETGVWLQHNGTVTEDLTEEDTDAAALARAKAAIEYWSAGLECQNATAFEEERTSGFSFSFRAGQVRVAWAAVPGVSYRVKVRFARRALGSAGPFLYYSEIEQTVSADVEAETTDWIDVPSEAGWETIAANCGVCRLTSGGGAEMCT